MLNVVFKMLNIGRYYIQCFCAGGECWHVRRSLTEVIKLRNALLKDGQNELEEF